MITFQSANFIQNNLNIASEILTEVKTKTGLNFDYNTTNLPPVIDWNRVDCTEAPQDEDITKEEKDITPGI